VAKPPSGELYAVRVATFTSLERASALRNELESRYRDARVYAGESGYRVVVAQGSRSQAESAQSRLAAEGFRDSVVFRRSR
jgi:cell division protein FtsN